MKNNWKEYVLYPAVTAVVCLGITAFADWKRDSLESLWWYVIAALILYSVLVICNLIFRRKKK